MRERPPSEQQIRLARRVGSWRLFRESVLRDRRLERRGAHGHTGNVAFEPFKVFACWASGFKENRNG
jgi:hypothetical protein